MKQDRFLIGILIGIVVLIVVALTVFLARQNKQTYMTEVTPEGVVHNYILALLNKDYQKAYGYLADLDNKPGYDEFRQSFVLGGLNANNGGMKIGESLISGNLATVDVIVVYTSSDPFSRGYDNGSPARLIRQNGAWKISSMQAFDLWNSTWYQATPKP